MSQYRKRLANGNLVIYGFDRMTSQYFVSEFLPDEPGKEDSELEVFGISSYGTITTKDHPQFPGKEVFANHEIAAILESYGVIDQQHIDHIYLDLPI